MDITVFDIETGIDEERFDRFHEPFKKERPEETEFDPGSVKLGNIKDEAKQKEKIEAARVKHEEEQAQAGRDWEREGLEHIEKQRDKAALYPALAEIVAIGWQVPGCNPQELILGDNVETEKELVQTFLAVVTELIHNRHTGAMAFGFWSGNNNPHRSFDPGHIEWACVRHGIKLPGELFAPPNTSGSRWKDIAAPFFRHGGPLPKMQQFPGYLSLNDALDLTNGFGQTVEGEFGSADLVVADKDNLDVEGATFAEWVRAGEFGKARDYLRNDVIATRWLSTQNPFR